MIFDQFVISDFMYFLVSFAVSWCAFLFGGVSAGGGGGGGGRGGGRDGSDGVITIIWCTAEFQDINMAKQDTPPAHLTLKGKKTPRNSDNHELCFTHKNTITLNCVIFKCWHWAPIPPVFLPTPSTQEKTKQTKNRRILPSMQQWMNTYVESSAQTHCQQFSWTPSACSLQQSSWPWASRRCVAWCVCR